MTESERVVRDLARVARKRVETEGKAIVLRDETDRLILEGYALGVPKKVLARESGLTRQTVYTVILREEARKG